MSAGVAYLDASAFVKLVVSEPESAALRDFLDGAESIFSAAILLTEVGRAVRRAATLGRVDAAPLLARADELLDSLVLLEVDRALLREAVAIHPESVRSLDAIHLAAARTLESDLSAFATYDQRLATAAAGYGLPVVSPV